MRTLLVFVHHLDLHLILAPLKKASLCFECESSRMADVIPVFMVMMTAYKDMLNNPCHFVKSLVKHCAAGCWNHDIFAQRGLPAVDKAGKMSYAI